MKNSWKPYRGEVDIIHGGPPCQPFSVAGKQQGNCDRRDKFPEFIRAILEIEPRVFVAENVPALLGSKFKNYVSNIIEKPLTQKYKIYCFILKAVDFGIPQIRNRVFWVGFREEKAAQNYCTDIDFDSPAPTLRSGLTGPRHTTSVLSSSAAQKTWDKLQIWPNGVAANRQNAHLFVAPNRHFRLSVSDCALIQGFPESWSISGAVYMALGQIGNAVPPPMAYQVACSIAEALS